MEATGFGVMHVDAERPHHRASSRSRRIRRPCPDKPDMALASMGIYVFETKFLFDAAPPRRRRPDLEPRFRQGHHPLHRQERQGLRPPLRQVLRALRARDRGLLARRRHRRCLLGGQYRPHRHRAGARSLRPRTGRSGPMPSSTPPAKFVHDEDGRRGTAVSSLVSGGCIVSGASVRRTLLFTGVPGQFLRRPRGGGGAALRADRPRRAAHARWSSTAASTSPRAWWSARIRSSTPSASAAPRAASA